MNRNDKYVERNADVASEECSRAALFVCRVITRGILSSNE